MQTDIKHNVGKPIIEVRQLGKKYNIAHMKGGYVALRDVLANIFKSPFSFLKHKAKDAVGLNRKEEFWALRDVNFSIEKGEVVGVIGHNGAGKSTLLKILSQITPPTEGEVVLRGRVGSLLEVGTGFHPELTGRENIFLNGAILGMKKNEIEQKFNNIVEFAGIDKFLDTPVKHYSSGMYVRLAFSVAAHMEPDILLVDEVLAVGDAEFQKKCLGKMDEITRTHGRTILFVSHNMGAIRKLCDRTILMERGKIKKIGKTESVIDEYIASSKSYLNTPLSSRINRSGNGDLRISDCYLMSDGTQTETSVGGTDTTFVFEYQCKPGKKLDGVIIGFNITTLYGESIILCHSKMATTDLGTLYDKGLFSCTIEKIPLVPGMYSIGSIRVESRGNVLDEIQNIYSFEVIDGDFFGNGFSEKHSLVYVNQSWSIKINAEEN